MSSRDEEIAEMKADIEALDAERRAATTPEERKDLLNAITAMRNQLTEMIRASGNFIVRFYYHSTPYLFTNTAPI